MFRSQSMNQNRSIYGENTHHFEGNAFNTESHPITISQNEEIYMTTQGLANKVIQSFNKKITDEVFLHIQNDRELMHDYLRTVSEHGIDKVNKKIGMTVRQTYGLSKVDREKEPASTLIQSHQKFE